MQSNLIVANAYGKKTYRLNHVDINTAKPSHHRSLIITFATWNAHSVNKESATICDLINNNNNNNNNKNNNTLSYSVKSSSKATQSSLIGDTDHNTGISLLH